MKGTSCGMLAKTTSLAQPMPSRVPVAWAVLRICLPMRATASMLMPAREEATLMDEHTRSVLARASGRDSMSALSPGVMPFSTRAPNPPRKSTPASLAASSSIWQALTIWAGEKPAPTTAMGLTLMRLLTTGMP